MGPRDRGRAALPVLALACASGCFEPSPPPWRIDGPRLLLIEMEVIEVGPHTPPLTLDPPGLTRREGLPGDRVALRPIVVGPGGPVTPNGPPIWLLSRDYPSPYYHFEAPIPGCPDVDDEQPPLCRLDGPEVALPLPQTLGGRVRPEVVVVVFGTPGGPSSETCLGRLSDQGRESLHGCLVGGAVLPYGPPHSLVPYGIVDPDTPVTDPNYNLAGVGLSLEIRGASGVRTQIAAHGEVVEVDPEDAIIATPTVDEAQLQEYVEGGNNLGTEGLGATWWSDADLFADDWNDVVDRPFAEFTIPPVVARFDLHLQISDRPPYDGAGGGGNWLWVRFQVRGRGDAGS